MARSSRNISAALTATTMEKATVAIASACDCTAVNPKSPISLAS